MKFFKFIAVITLLVFSFSLTDYVTELAIYNNPLMKSIYNKTNSYNIESVDAIIENNTIIPGIKGKKVNEMESYLNMKDFGLFNDNYLIFDSVIPEISISNNLDKIIISGNKSNRNVSVLIDKNIEIIDYNIKNKIKYSKFVRINDDLEHDETINVESDKTKFDDLNTLLNKNKTNKNICILNYSNIELCRKNKYYIVKPSIYLNNNNYIQNINNINNGSIIFIDNNFSLNNYKILISYLHNKDINIVFLSKIIDE